MKYDFNKCTKEQLVQHLSIAYGSIKVDSYEKEYHKTRDDMLKTAEVKLRTRAEVDADIAGLVRKYSKEYHRGYGGPNWDGLAMYASSLNRLCEEETQG
jgi:hypothetical protein